MRTLRESTGASGVVLWNGYELQMARSGSCVLSDKEVSDIALTAYRADDWQLMISKRPLRIGARVVGALVLCGHSLDARSTDAIAALTAIAMERAIVHGGVHG